MQTHLEPLEEPLVARADDDDPAAARIAALVEERTGNRRAGCDCWRPKSAWSSSSTSSLSPEVTLEAAHDMARRLEQEIRRSRPEGSARIVDVVVHTEP